MNSLCIVLALLGQFQVEELPAVLPNQPGTFIQEELVAPKSLEVKPHFEFLGASWCGVCKPTRALVDAIPKEKRPFTYSYRDIDSRGNLGAASVPAWAYNGRVFQYGYSTPENLMENFRKATQPKSRATRTVQRLSSAQLKAFANSYRGEPYGVDDGNFWIHLQSPNHGFTAQQLSGLTQAECANIHAGHHWGYLTPFSIGGK